MSLEREVLEQLSSSGEKAIDLLAREEVGEHHIALRRGCTQGTSRRRYGANDDEPVTTELQAEE
jgi:hypothetical protein